MNVSQGTDTDFELQEARDMEQIDPTLKYRVYKFLDDMDMLIQRSEASIAKVEAEAEMLRSLRKKIVELVES